MNKACYAIRAVKSLISLKSLICIYHSYFHSLLQYGILFWGNSPTSGDIFKIQKRTIRIITNKGRLESCRDLFRNLKILTLSSQYVLSVRTFLVENRHYFIPNRDRHNLDLHLPPIYLSVVQRGVLYSGCKIFNNLPLYIKSQVGNSEHFTNMAKSFLLEQATYNLDGYFKLSSQWTDWSSYFCYTF